MNTDDHLRNHGFLWQGQQGWTLSPAYDINLTPADIESRILATNIDSDDGTCSVELLCSVAEEFSLKVVDGDRIIGAVAAVVQNWRDFARGRGAREAGITRIASAFEHGNLERALALSG